MSSITGKVNSKGGIAGLVSPPSGVKNYEDLAGLPSINGVQVSGDKTSADYGLKSGDFIVNFSRKDEDDGTYSYSADKTFQEVKNAYEQGRMLIGFSYSGKQLSLDTANPSFRFMFSVWDPSGLRYETFSLMLTEDVLYTNRSMTALDKIVGGVKADPKTDEDTIPARIGEDDKLYISAQPKNFIITVDWQNNSDKTNEEIYQAYQEERTILLKKSIEPGSTYELSGVPSSTQAKFIRLTATGNTSIIIENGKATSTTTVAKPTQNTYGVIKANAATENDTIPVNIDDDGFLKASAQPKNFIVNITRNNTEDEEHYTKDKSFSEIKSALDSGANVYCIVDATTIGGCKALTDSVIVFIDVIGLSRYTITVKSDESVTYSLFFLTSGPNRYGGIKANSVTENDTIPVNVDEDGFLKASVNIPEKTDEDTSTYDKITPIKIDPKTRTLYGKNDYLPGKSVYYWNDNFGHTNDLGTIMAGSYSIGLVSGKTNVDGMTLPIFVIKGSTERGLVNFTGLDSSGNIWKGSYNLMNMEVSSLAKVTLGGS